MQARSLCLVVPVYNEFKRLAVDTYCSFMADQGQIHLIFVNDASTDHTDDKLLAIHQAYPDRIEIIHHKARAGKAEAIRTGMLNGVRSGRYEYFGFIDADLAVPLSDIVVFTERLSTDKGRMAFGVRADNNKRNINRTVFRNIMGNLFRAYLHQGLNFPIADSQCGAKVFAAEIIPVLYDAPFKTHWLSDVELMIRFCRHFGIKRQEIHKHLIQVPVSKFEDKADSKVNAIEMLRTLKELLVISLYPDLSTKG